MDFAAAGGLGALACSLLILACLAFLYYGSRLAVADAREHLLPDRFTLPLNTVVLVGCIAAALVSGRAPVAGRVVVCAAIATAAFLAVHLISPATLGFGDVKLVPALGGITGLLSWGHPVLAFVLAILVAGVHALIVMVVKRDRKAHIAFGPALLVGTTIALCL